MLILLKITLSLFQLMPQKDSWLSEDSSDNKNNMDRERLDDILDFMLNKMKKKYCTY